jgi:hypothetical protein
MYAHVENGSVDFLGALPKNWRNISGLNLSEGNAEFLKSLGWLPVVTTETTPKSQQVRDTDQVTVEEDRVVVVQRVRAKTAEEIEADWVTLRSRRNQRLLESDWVAVTDSALSVGKKLAWASYRTDLRDLPLNTSDPTDPPWPIKPE